MYRATGDPKYTHEYDPEPMSNLEELINEVILDGGLITIDSSPILLNSKRFRIDSPKLLDDGWFSRTSLYSEDIESIAKIMLKRYKEYRVKEDRPIYAGVPE